MHSDGVVGSISGSNSEAPGLIPGNEQRVWKSLRWEKITLSIQQLIEYTLSCMIWVEVSLRLVGK